jgi:hypothetical protein
MGPEDTGVLLCALRAFIAVPSGAAWAELTLRAGPFDTPRLFLLRGTQVRVYVRVSVCDCLCACVGVGAYAWGAGVGVCGESTAARRQGRERVSRVAVSPTRTRAVSFQPAHSCAPRAPTERTSCAPR